MQQDFFISVIIPVFNSQKYIGRCLRSLKNQSLNKKNYEIIVVNDFSKDNSLNEILKQKTNIIKVINNEKNLGLPASLNIGLKLAKGSFIVRVDSDDWVHVDFLNILSTFLYINKSLDAVACDYSLVDENENIIKEVNCDNKPVGCGIMFRMQHLLEINLYDEKFLYCEEEALRNEFEKKYKIHRIELPLYRYRRHPQNITNNKKKLKEYFKEFNKKHGKK